MGRRDDGAGADSAGRAGAALSQSRRGGSGIRDDADKLTEEVRKGGNALELLLRKAKSTLKALDVELTEAEEAKSAPVMLPAASLAQAREALLESSPSPPALKSA